MERFYLYLLKPPVKDRFVPFDRLIRPLISKLLGRRQVGGISKVFTNVQKGLSAMRVPFMVNLAYSKLPSGSIPVILGLGKHCLQGYPGKNKIIAGIGLMTHPAEWPDLFEQYPVVYYLQHSEWTNAIYRKFYGDRCRIWPVGIETEHWKPDAAVKKDIDVLIYDKILWDRPQNEQQLLGPIASTVKEKGLTCVILRYGQYTPEQYRELLNRSACMVFLCEHESQGIAYQEALAMNVPIFAWDQGYWLDPNRFKWGETEPVKATSVPYFDGRCGGKFKDTEEFINGFDPFYQRVLNGEFSARAYILEHLTLEKSTQQLLGLLDAAKEEP